MAGSSVGAMVVGTVFIMVFGMATVTMVESIDESVKNSEYELSEPEVTLVSVTDKQESTGPIAGLSFSSPSTNSAGTGYTSGDQCELVSSGTGSGASVNIIVTAGEIVGFGLNIVPGNGYSVGEIVTINCGSNPNSGDYSVSSIEDQNTITVRNTGSETVDLSHIFLTLSDTGTKVQGTPFTPFVNHYSGTNLYLFPGEQLSTDAFPLDSNTHGFEIDDDPDRAFLAIYEYNDAETVTIT
jgi:hypothetical protein